MAISFKKPPLSEVALGYTFLPRPDLLIPHLGLFWGDVRDAYPGCQHATPIIDNPEFELVSDLPLPRVWLTSGDNARLIQLQQDRLLFNWRDSGDGTPYIRFPSIRQEFERVDALFKAHVHKLTSVALHPTSYTLTYVNLIRSGEGWSSMGDLGEIFPDLTWRSESRFLPRPTEMAWKSTFPLPDGFGSLTAHIQPGKLVRTEAPILKLELNASSGSLGGKVLDMREWVTLAHDWITQAFKDLTSTHIQEKNWQREDGV